MSRGHLSEDGTPIGMTVRDPQRPERVFYQRFKGNVRFYEGTRVRDLHGRTGTVRAILMGADICVWWDDEGDYSPSIAHDCMSVDSIEPINVLDELLAIEGQNDA